VNFSDILVLLSNNVAEILGVILALRVTAEVVVNLTPTPKDDLWLGRFYKVVEAIAGIHTQIAKQKPGQQEFVKRATITEVDRGHSGKSVVVSKTDMSEVDKYLGITPKK